METFASTDTKAQALARLNTNFAETTSELAGKAASAHGHLVSEVTGLQAALDGKATLSHVHAIENVTGLQAALDGKAASAHTHAISNVTGLQAALDGKQAAGSYATQADLDALTTTVGNIEAALIAING